MASLLRNARPFILSSTTLHQSATSSFRQTPLYRLTGRSSIQQRLRTGCLQHRHTATSLPSRSTVVVSNPSSSRIRRFVSFILIASISFTVGGYIAFTYAPPLLSPRIMGSIPTDAETLIYEAPDDLTREIDLHITKCELAKSLRANPDFLESRPHRKLPDAVKQHNLTAGTLSGNQMLAVPPLIFNEKGGKSMVCIFYAGTDLCGHPGMVHGGFLATMLDEGLARCAFPAMPNQVGVTANLTINYLEPTMAGQYLVVRATTVKVEGRKAWAEGWIEPLETKDNEQPMKLVEATALFIEPRHARVMKSLYKVGT